MRRPRGFGKRPVDATPRPCYIPPAMNNNLNLRLGLRLRLVSAG